MSQSRRDQNSATAGLGVSSSDLITPLPLRVDPVTDYLLTHSINSSNSATSATQNKRDQNDKPTMYGISDTDGVTLIPIRTDSNGNLLTKST